MNELAQALTAESAHAATDHILEGLSDDLPQRRITGAPHTVYEELWHLALWQRMTLDWISGIETPYPEKTTDPLPTGAQVSAESWPELCQRFLDGAKQVASVAADPTRLTKIVRCPSRLGHPVRPMSVQDQLISLAAHNSYHFGRIVLLRQLMGAWPSGDFTW